MWTHCVCLQLYVWTDLFVHMCVSFFHIYRAKWQTSLDSPRFTSTSPWWSASWSSAASTRNLPSSPMLSRTLWVERCCKRVVQNPWSVCASLCYTVYLVHSADFKCSMFWAVLSLSVCFWGCFVPVQASSTLTQRARLLLAAHRICPPYPCVTSLSYFLHICNIFSESLPWNHRRFSLHHNVLVVHEVGLRCTQHPQTHTLLYAWWFALITVNSNRSFVVVLLNCSVLKNKLEK